MAKPFSPREVVARVRAVLRRASGQRPQTDVIRAGPILLNRAAHAVTVNDAPIELTRTEFALLDALMQNAGRTLNRLQLIEQALGYSYDGYDRTIDAHIRDLRHKLEPDPSAATAMWSPCTAWDTSSLEPSMRASLFVKLLIAFGLVVLMGTGLMVFLANRAASGGFTVFVDQTSQRRAQQAAPLFLWYHRVTGSWAGIDDFLQQPAPIPDSARRRAGVGPAAPESSIGSWLVNDRILLIGREGDVVFDSHMDTEGEVASPELLASAMPLGRREQRTGWLLFAQPAGNTLESSFFDRVNRWLLWSGLGTGGVDFVVGPFPRSADHSSDATAYLECYANVCRRPEAESERLQSGRGRRLGPCLQSHASRLEFTELQRRMMVADIAHELRSPLTVMQGKLEGMMDGVFPLDQEQVGTVYDHTLLLSRLVDDLRASFSSASRTVALGEV